MDNIKYYKWNKTSNKLFMNTCKEYLNIKDPQIYFPILSLYFYIHNTKNANKLIDIDRRYYLLEFNDCIDSKYFNSNTIHNCNIYDSLKDIKYSKEILQNVFHY